MRSMFVTEAVFKKMFGTGGRYNHSATSKPLKDIDGFSGADCFDSSSRGQSTRCRQLEDRNNYRWVEESLVIN